jgi:hypothetical protein
MKKLALIFVSLCSVNAMAAQFGEAGCGLGSVLFGANGNQVLAATTNGSSYTQIFGITSGTSNCTDGGRVRSSYQVPLFIEVNRVALAKDAARGEGETLAGLAQLMGCQEKSFGPALKSNYDAIFVKTDMQPSAIRTSIESMVQKNHSQACGV